MKKNIQSKLVLTSVLLLVGLFVFQGQTFYGKRRTGFYATKEDGAAFGYYVPRELGDSLKQKRVYPLMVVFAQKATAAMKWKNIADKDKMVVVAIQPKIGGIWNYEWDLTRALKKINELKTRFPIDENKIWATGYEKGGFFALVMAIDKPTVFAAAAAVDCKTANTTMLRGQADQAEFAGPFAYQDDPAKQCPLWLMNYTKSEYVSAEDLAKTKEILGKYNYPVTYTIVDGEPHSPSQKVIRQIYSWLQSQTK